MLDREEVCRAADDLIGTYKWRLIKRDQLVDQVCARGETAAVIHDPKALRKLCLKVVAEQLFALCERGLLRTAYPDEKYCGSRALEDLGRYLRRARPRLLHNPPQGSTEDSLVVDALEAISRSIHTCEHPPSFLAWSLVILQRVRDGELRKVYRVRKHELASNWEDEGEAEKPSDPMVQAALLQAITTNERRNDYDSEFFQILGQCLLEEDQRTVALAVYLLIKPSDTIGTYPRLAPDYKNLRQSALYRLTRCGRATALKHQDEQTAFDCKLSNCPVKKSARRK